MPPKRRLLIWQVCIATLPNFLDAPSPSPRPNIQKIFTYYFTLIISAAILGFHSMMNQDQYHASLLNKGQPVGLGWDGITKTTPQKIFPADPPNNTDVEDSIKRVKDDDPKLIELNLNNIKVSVDFR